MVRLVFRPYTYYTHTHTPMYGMYIYIYINMFIYIYICIDCNTVPYNNICRAIVRTPQYSTSQRITTQPTTNMMTMMTINGDNEADYGTNDTTLPLILGGTKGVPRNEGR